MRALVIPQTGVAEVRALEDLEPQTGDVVVEVERVGICGTDLELFNGTMAYLHEGHAHHPLYLGHEWSGTVSKIGDGVDPSWVGRRVTADTLIGCGTCHRCVTGYQHVCATRAELGVRDGRRGALAEQVAVPARVLHALPDEVDATMGALVEPGGNSLRAVWAADVRPGERALVMGPGTIGLLAGMFLRANGVEVHLLGETDQRQDFARSLGFEHTWTAATLPKLPFDAVVDASNAAALPRLAVQLVEPGRRVVFIGLAGEPSTLDTRALALNDVTAVGILGASGGIAATIESYASGQVDPRSLVAATVSMEDVGEALAGRRLQGAGPGPKIHIDPRL